MLGHQYSHLNREGVLMAASSVLGVIGGLAWGLNASRAWIISPDEVHSLYLCGAGRVGLLAESFDSGGVLIFFHSFYCPKHGVGCVACA